VSESNEHFDFVPLFRRRDCRQVQHLTSVLRGVTENDFRVDEVWILDEIRLKEVIQRLR
jgi:hypothetical protein